ncbi:hypothetical protein LSCM4_02163 [Leishmania orientalis]|uniref:Uncharacterized protein n=1 Tax=Leishmania orientalis TaxID=2249476 RepID=A0A836KP02_9TRYP|nr:hypothetical protein LSCM4_02163 [Leishmania orientalis]
MFKSSLATHSSIDHDLFPLLTVRSCVSEADESKNGPRFCAEDKMTGGAYEIRSRKLDLEAEVLAVGTAATGAGRMLSPNDLAVIKRQQQRINALLTATAHCSVPPCVALPIDVYIQEQPSTGHTYVASVDAFSGLSLGDIIRSGWGVMEERVFLEILNAVEGFGYASASLPPHGNLSSDAIKQLLIVRDGASEARQPSRWVVSDWLLLSDDSVASFDAQAFVADLEWVLHSSFAQLHISAGTAQGNTLLPANRVEELVSETVDRIRTHLLRQNAKAHNYLPAGKSMQLPDAGALTDANASPENTEASASGVTDTDGTSARRPSDSNEDGVSTVFHVTHDSTTDLAATAAVGTLEPHATAVVDRAKTVITETAAAVSSPNTPLAASLVSNNIRSSRSAADNRDSAKEASSLAGQMSLKDKVAYHQAALRNEQLLVNKHRRKNAPLPPRPQPVWAETRNPRPPLSPSPSEEEFYYDPPSLTSPIEVKPSAYLMQGRRPSANGRGANSTRKLQSPRSARTPNGESRTPREHSRSTTATPQSQQPPVTSSSPASPDLLRERLLDNVVSLAMFNQRRRAQIHRLQQEAERRRREQRQQALSLSTPPQGGSGRQVAARVFWEKPRAVTPSPPALSSFFSPLTATAATDNHRQATRRSGRVLSGPAGSPIHGGDAVNSGYHPNRAAALNAAAMKRFRCVSESPEPTPPSPCSCRIVNPTLCEKTPLVKASVGTPVASIRGVNRGAGDAALQSPSAQSAGKATALQKTASYPVGAGTVTTTVRSATVKTVVSARSVTALGKVVASVTTRSGGNSNPPSTAGAVFRYGGGALGTGNQGGDPVGQQPRSERLTTAASLTHRSHGAATASTLLASQQKTAQQSTAAPFVKPLPLQAILRSVKSSRVVPTANGPCDRPQGSCGDAGQPVLARSAVTRPSGTLARFSDDFPRARVTCAEPEVQRYPNTSRPLPAQQHLSMSPRVYRRVSSTGVLPSPRNGVIMPPARLSAATLPSPPTQEPPRSARQRPTQSKVFTQTELNSTQPRPPISADAKSANGLGSVNRKPMQCLALQTVCPKRSAGLSSTHEAQTTHAPPTVANQESLTSPHLPPPPAQAASAAALAVRRSARVNPSDVGNAAETEKRTPRGRCTGEATTLPSARPATASERVKQMEKKNVAYVTALRTESPTLGIVRPVNEVSLGIHLRRYHSRTN